MDRGYNRTLAIDLFETGRITERIIEGQKASDKAQRETNMRLGYMGHLTLIAEEVVKFTEKYPPEILSQTVLEKVMDPEWIDYVEHTLAETRERDNAILGGVRPELSLGPRTALFNSGGQGFSSGGSASDLDTIDLANGTGGVGAGGSFGPVASGGAPASGVLLSGFGSSSDEEDEDIDREDDEEEEITRLGIGASNDQVGDILFDDDIDPEDVDEDLIAKYFPIFEE